MAMRSLRPLLGAIALALALCSCHVAADQQTTIEPPADGVVHVRLAAHPNEGTAAAIDIASFGAVYADAQQQPASKQQEAMTPAATISVAAPTTDSSVSGVSVVVDQQRSAAVPHSPSKHEQPRVYVPVPEHMQEDPLQPLFSFDAATEPEAMQTDSSHDGGASTSTAGNSGAHVSAFASLVLRVQRRVTSVGFWAPNTRGPPQADPSVPPATPPGVTSNTLNLLATATYARSAGSVSRALRLSVLPGPSFARGSMAAHAERFGPEATGFQHALFTLRDKRALLPSSDGSGDASVQAAPRSGEELISFAPEEAASGPVEPRLPGFGPVGTLRTMSGQHNENWVIYSGGVLRPSSARDATPGQSVRLVHNVALYTLLVTAWHDPQLVRAHMDAHRALSEAAQASGASPPPPLSYNALGVRLRVTADFAVRPFERNVAVLTVPSEGTGEGSTWNNQAGMSAAELHGELATSGPAAASPAFSYARIVDFVMHQQRKLILIGVAYDDGFIRIISRSGTVRNELHTGNETILLIGMSNWGTSTSLGPSTGGGARDPNGALNGANNGNQHMAYVTPSGIGIVRMARIHARVDAGSYCRWDEQASLGIAHGRDLSAVAFDPLAHSILYLVSHATDSLVVLHTRLGWDHAQSARNFDDAGLRAPCPPGGCACHASASVPMRFAPARSGASLGPQYALLPLRGYLLVGSARARAVAVYNTSTINALPNEPGLEFMLERQVGPAPAIGSGREGTAPRSRMHLERMTGDRIELVVAGFVGSCEHGVCSAAVPSSSDAQSLHLHLLQNYLPQPDQHSSKSGAFASWVGSSRVPLFLLGLAGVLAWQWVQKRRRNGGGGGGRGGDDAAEMEAMLARFGRGGKGKGGARGPGDFDPKSFMSDFEAWQSAQQGGGGGVGGRGSASASARSASKLGSRASAQQRPRHQQAATSPAYFDILESDRARVRNSSARSSGPGGPARAAYGLHQLDELQRQRVQMRRRLAAMDTDDEAALRGLGVGGAIKTATAPRFAASSASASARPSSTSAPLVERFTDPEAERAFANDPSDGMRAESMRGVSYDSEDEGMEEGEGSDVDADADLHRGEPPALGDESDAEVEEEEDGAGEYQYEHADYSGGDGAALLALHRATGGSSHTFPIDSLEGMSFSHEDELARFGAVEEGGAVSEGEEEDDDADGDDPAQQQWQSMRSRTAGQRAAHVSQPFPHDTYAVDQPSAHVGGFARGPGAPADYRDAVSYDSEDDFDGDEAEFDPAADPEGGAFSDGDANDDDALPRFIDADHHHAQHVQDDDLDLDHDDNAPDEWIDEQQVDEAERSMRLARLQQADDQQAKDDGVMRGSTA